MLALRVGLLLGRESGLVRGRASVESGRARDLIGLAILAGAVVYALRVERATLWFLIASGAAFVAQLAGFYLRSASRKPASPGGSEREESSAAEHAAAVELGEEELDVCPSCGHAALIELVDVERLMGGLNQLTRVGAAVCPSCGCLTGQVEDASKIPIGAEHGTALRQSPAGPEQEALELPSEHDG